MQQILATQAVTNFDKLLNQVAQGQDIVIIGSDGKAFKLLALPHIPQPIFGSARGLVQSGVNSNAVFKTLPPDCQSTSCREIIAHELTPRSTSPHCA